MLAEVPRIPDNPFVIPGRINGTCMRNINTPWEIIRERAGLEDVRLHDLRHSFASRALALGESLPMIGKLLGHSQIETTARYAHLARESVHESAARRGSRCTNPRPGSPTASRRTWFQTEAN